MNGLIEKLGLVVGAANVLTGADMARYARDWMGKYEGAPVAVVRPGSTAEVAGCLRVAAAEGLAVVPVGGNTGLVGGTMTKGGLMVSLERMNRIRELRAEARIVVAEAGVVLSRLHEAAEAVGLYFPLWFGARGSAMLGGVLSTNAGGSNVLRYGSTRGLCLGLEVVLVDGRVMNLMSALHKDNSGYDLKNLFIGAEGTLGIITAAVMKLVPAPRAHATATVAARALGDALQFLNRMQEATGGRVEAFEFMPATYSRRLAEVRPDLGQPFDHVPEVTILIEAATTAPAEATPDDTGAVPLVSVLEGILGEMLEAGLISDAVVAQNEAQRRVMWARREAAAEITVGINPKVDTDVCLPLDKVEAFLDEVLRRLERVDPGATSLTVAHLGDGNLHFTAFPTRDDPGLNDRVMETVEDVVADLGGSFSAEHGVGLSKLNSMARRKDAVALDVMRAIRAALDPEGRMNPGKVIPG
ncbi:MAG: FAD-binding oxidoreductase [Tabrizicola sp.]|uniref:FAD-binding oxidoreductase n=1 Tax=Tabrizicola sp. TaxID=2005166 RepID=UPI0027326638|nr:FAD-binding oxidoreductase [Tabrizicola sp.]MDP3262368.1 FAD-binding oxidoreductase [Tabrizicola sp.]MDP3647885.1 FAD-binding oxidoreductase [Paracoccaceae bacterium]MDZ4069897.1 FAD-binding oxidoreductase [Tabrizicola sp.]